MEIEKCENRLKNVVINTHARVFSHIFAYFRVFSRIFAYFRIFSRIFAYFRVFSRIFAYFRIFSHIFAYFRKCKGFSKINKMIMKPFIKNICLFTLFTETLEFTPHQIHLHLPHRVLVAILQLFFSL